MASRLDHLSVCAIREPVSDFFATHEFALVVQGSIRAISLPDASLLLVNKRAGLPQFPILAIPFPFAGHLAVRVSAGRFQQPIAQVVFPFARLFAVVVFADAGHCAILEELLEDTVLQPSVSTEFSIVHFHLASLINTSSRQNALARVGARHERAIKPHAAPTPELCGVRQRARLVSTVCTEEPFSPARYVFMRNLLVAD